TRAASYAVSAEPNSASEVATTKVSSEGTRVPANSTHRARSACVRGRVEREVLLIVVSSRPGIRGRSSAASSFGRLPSPRIRRGGGSGRLRIARSPAHGGSERFQSSGSPAHGSSGRFRIVRSRVQGGSGRFRTVRSRVQDGSERFRTSGSPVQGGSGRFR